MDRPRLLTKEYNGRRWRPARRARLRADPAARHRLARPLAARSPRRSSSSLGAAREARLAREVRAVFVAFGGYALIWGWKFGARRRPADLLATRWATSSRRRREGLNPSWPVFIPFLGAYVKYTRGNPWQTARVAIAGPILGGVAALACYLVGRADGSDLLDRARLLRLRASTCSTCCRSGILDGGAVWRSTRWLWLGGGREKAIVSGVALRRHGRAAPARRVRGVPPAAPALDGRPAAARLARGARPTEAIGADRRTSSRRASRSLAQIDRPAVAVFGSARIAEDDPDYATARAIGARVRPRAAGR